MKHRVSTKADHIKHVPSDEDIESYYLQHFAPSAALAPAGVPPPLVGLGADVQDPAPLA